MTRPRDKWASSTQAMRGSPIRGFTLPRDMHAALDRLADRRENLSALADEALRQHPKVREELDRGAQVSGPCALDTCPYRGCADPSHRRGGT
jgi:hypothetical protein